MIEAHGLFKRYGSTMAVNDLSFSIRPAMVTGFLGPNGAGKTTTMRMILGLDAPTQGSVTVGGRSYRDLPAPMREVGALLDAKALHDGRRACDHLLCLAQPWPGFGVMCLFVAIVYAIAWTLLDRRDA